jgi:hypothetical protein
MRGYLEMVNRYYMGDAPFEIGPPTQAEVDFATRNAVDLQLAVWGLSAMAAGHGTRWAGGNNEQALAAGRNARVIADIASAAHVQSSGRAIPVVTMASPTSRRPRPGDVANAGRTDLDWGRISKRTGGDAAHHVTVNNGSSSLTKPNQGVFYGNPVATIEDSWAIAKREVIEPVTVGNRDIYVVPRPNSGCAAGMAGQRGNFDHVTIITEAGTSRSVTGYPSGGTPPLPKGYDFLLGRDL